MKMDLSLGLHGKPSSENK